MSAASEYDQRQYRRMLQTIFRYENGNDSLRNLVYDLQTLVGVLEEKDIGWSTRYTNLWGPIDDIYQVVVSYKGKGITEDDQREILNRTAALKSLIAEKVADSDLTDPGDA